MATKDWGKVRGNNLWIKSTYKILGHIRWDYTPRGSAHKPYWVTGKYGQKGINKSFKTKKEAISYVKAFIRKH